MLTHRSEGFTVLAIAVGMALALLGALLVACPGPKPEPSDVVAPEPQKEVPNSSSPSYPPDYWQDIHDAEEALKSATPDDITEPLEDSP